MGDHRDATVDSSFEEWEGLGALPVVEPLKEWPEMALHASRSDERFAPRRVCGDAVEGRSGSAPGLPFSPPMFTNGPHLDAHRADVDGPLLR